MREVVGRAPRAAAPRGPVRAAAAAFLVAALSALGAGSCGESGEDVCELYCECEYCSERDERDCNERFQSEERSADFRDCVDEFDDYIVCQVETGRCDVRQFSTDCRREEDTLRACLQ